VNPAPGLRMGESGRERIPENPRQYVCPSCRLHLLSWTTHTNTIEMFHKVALWSDFWTGDVCIPTSWPSTRCPGSPSCPLVTMIFGFGLLAKVVLAWLIVFFIVFFNTFQGARGVDPDLIHSARFLGASERQVMRTVIVPSALAWTFASLTPSVSFALIGVVIGEFIGGESGGGIGYLIIASLGSLNAADMMVALLVLGLTGIVLALGIHQVEARLLRWRPEYQSGG
jgi:Binding-protein-dependent transport system inner membrane component